VCLDTPLFREGRGGVGHGYVRVLDAVRCEARDSGGEELEGEGGKGV
jgi:hypothetical protein